jgi:hypothetical protein
MQRLEKRAARQGRRGLNFGGKKRFVGKKKEGGRKAVLLKRSAADVDGAEAEDDVAAGGWPAEAEHGPEA